MMPRKGRPPRRQRRLSGGPPRKPSKYNLFIKRMTKGGKMTLKQAAAKWRKGGTRAKPATRASPKPRTRSRAKPKPSGGRKMAGFNTQKLMKYIRLAALAAPAASAVMSHGANAVGANLAVARYTGYDIQGNRFSLDYLKQGWMPYLAAVAATYGIPKIAGIIRGL